MISEISSLFCFDKGSIQYEKLLKAIKIKTNEFIFTKYEKNITRKIQLIFCALKKLFFGLVKFRQDFRNNEILWKYDKSSSVPQQQQQHSDS